MFASRMPKKTAKDPFYSHKVALRPLLHTLDAKETESLFSDLESVDQDKFVTFLHRQGLEQVWLSFLLKQTTLSPEFDALINELQLNALKIAGSQLMQQVVVEEVRDVFEGAGIEYLIFKGAHLRHVIYEDPTHRQVSDIDILIREDKKLDAIKALVQKGFSAHHAAENISHETSLAKNQVYIDLHWHLMRPGRTRIDLNDYLFEQKKPFLDFYGPSNEASLLIMLIHPAITKYVNGRASSLRHLLDIHHLAQRNDINWARLTDMLDRSGTRTAAWASLTWLQMLAYQPLYTQLIDQLKPGYLKKHWLQFWLNKGLTKKLSEKKVIIRGGFSLALQDNLKDVFNALGTLREEKQKTSQTMQAIEQLDHQS